MSLPSGEISLEGLTRLSTSMRKLQEQMEKLFPKELSALIKAHPEVESINWNQYSEAGFVLSGVNIERASSAKPFDEASFLAQVYALLDPMPSDSLLSLFSHNGTVTFNASGFNVERDPDGGGYGGGTRTTPGDAAFPGSPLGEVFTEYYELRDRAVKSLPKLLMEYVKANEEQLKSLRWFQYTPGFMDGDTCEFAAHGLRILPPNKSEYISIYKPTRDTKKLLGALERLLDGLHPDILYALYGDHMEVTVTSNKIVTEEYNDHE
jgi:hypothetical protein